MVTVTIGRICSMSSEGLSQEEAQAGGEILSRWRHKEGSSRTCAGRYVSRFVDTYVSECIHMYRVVFRTWAFSARCIARILDVLRLYERRDTYRVSIAYVLRFDTSRIHMGYMYRGKKNPPQRENSTTPGDFGFHWSS